MADVDIRGTEKHVIIKLFVVTPNDIIYRTRQISGGT
jgi:hypothetical protein